MTALYQCFIRPLPLHWIFISTHWASSVKLSLSVSLCCLRVSLSFSLPHLSPIFTHQQFITARPGDSCWALSLQSWPAPLLPLIFITSQQQPPGLAPPTLQAGNNLDTENTNQLTQGVAQGSLRALSCPENKINFLHGAPFADFRQDRFWKSSSNPEKHLFCGE